VTTGNKIYTKVICIENCPLSQPYFKKKAFRELAQHASSSDRSLL